MVEKLVRTNIIPRMCASRRTTGLVAPPPSPVNSPTPPQDPTKHRPRPFCTTNRMTPGSSVAPMVAQCPSGAHRLFIQLGATTPWPACPRAGAGGRCTGPHLARGSSNRKACEGKRTSSSACPGTPSTPHPSPPGPAHKASCEARPPPCARRPATGGAAPGSLVAPVMTVQGYCKKPQTPARCRG